MKTKKCINHVFLRDSEYVLVDNPFTPRNSKKCVDQIKIVPNPGK